MHLITLLVAAAFASQFAAVNDADPDFTVNFLKVNTNTDAVVSVTPKTGAAAWVAPVSILFSLEVVSTPSEVSTGWVTVTKGSDPEYSTADDFDFSELKHEDTDPIAEGDTVYVYLRHGEAGSETYLEVPATIDVTDLWWLEHDTIYVDTKVVTNVVIHGPKGGWTIEGEQKVKLHFHKAATPPAIADFKSTQETAASADNKWTLATIAVDQVENWAEGPLYAFISYATDSEPELEDEKVTTAIAASVAQYEIAPKTATLDEAAALTAITITPKAGFNLGETIGVKIAKADGGASNDDTPIVNPSVAFRAATGDYQITFLTTAFAEVQEIAVGAEYEVSVMTAATGTAYLAETDSLVLTEDPPPPPEFTVNKEDIKEAELEEAFEMEFTPHADQKDAWDAATAIVVTFTLTNDKPEDEGKNDIPLTFTLTETGASTGIWKGDIDLTTVAVEDIVDSKFYMWSALDDVYIETAVTIDFIPETPPAGETEWTIPETTVEFDTPLKIPKLAINITKGGESWATLIETNDLVFRLSVVETGRKNPPVDQIIDEITMDGDDFFIPETDISTFLLEAPAAGEFHTIRVQIGEEGEEGKWLDCETTIKIDPPAPTAEFTVKPDKVDLRTDTKVNVEVARKTGASTWEDEVHLFFSLTEVDAQPEDEKFVATTKGTDKWTGELDLSKLTGAKKGDSIYVYVKHQAPEAPGSNAKTGTWLEIPAVIAVDKSAEPEPEAAMGVSPLLSLLAAALLLLVKLF